jgi:hypothetical protein
MGHYLIAYFRGTLYITFQKNIMESICPATNLLQTFFCNI